MATTTLSTSNGFGEMGVLGAADATGVSNESGAPGILSVSAVPTRRVAVHLNLPFAIERRGRPEREQVVGWDGARAGAYLRALRREITANAAEFADCSVAAVRLGGGIASNAPAEDLWQVMRTLRSSLRLEEGAFISMRTSLCNVSGASMPYLRRAGVGRFDFELLALDSADFVRLNHTDSIQDLGYVVDSFLHAYANKTLGMVLAYGFDAPNSAAFRRSVVQVTRMPVAHLILEPWHGTCVGPASEALTAEQLGQAREVLAAAGFAEYAPLKFARPGDEDPFWALQEGGLGGQGASNVPGTPCEVLGFGLGATTRFGGVASTNTSDWDTYVVHAGDFARITAAVERIG